MDEAKTFNQAQHSTYKLHTRQLWEQKLCPEMWMFYMKVYSALHTVYEGQRHIYIEQICSIIHVPAVYILT